MQSLSFNPQLLAKSVEEVAEKLRATSRANEDVIQTVANQRVASAYEYALRYHHDNRPAPNEISIPTVEFGSPAEFAAKMKSEHRDTLVHFLTNAGVSHETAAGIIDSSIIKNADAG